MIETIGLGIIQQVIDCPNIPEKAELVELLQRSEVKILPRESSSLLAEARPLGAYLLRYYSPG